MSVTLEAAAADLWRVVDRLDLAVVRARRRPAVPLRAALLAGGMAAAAVAVVVAADPFDSGRSVPAGSVRIATAEDQLIETAVSAGSSVGWTLSADSSNSTIDASGPGRSVEARLTDAGGQTLLVNIRSHDPAAVAAGTTGRDGLLASDGDTRVYLGTESAQATAVELFMGESIIYVRSEAAGQPARPVEALTSFAIEVAASWADQPELVYDFVPSPTFITTDS